MSVNPIRVTVWNEYLHERTQADVAAIYPDGIHEALAAPLRAAGFVVRTSTQDQPEHGLTEGVLAETDVLLWWGHRHHHQVDDTVVTRVQARVLAGMGLIPLHSSHFSKTLMPTGTAAVLNAAELRLHREAALEVRRIDSGS